MSEHFSAFLLDDGEQHCYAAVSAQAARDFHLALVHDDGMTESEIADISVTELPLDKVVTIYCDDAPRGLDPKQTKTISEWIEEWVRLRRNDEPVGLLFSTVF